MPNDVKIKLYCLMVVWMTILCIFVMHKDHHALIYVHLLNLNGVSIKVNLYSARLYAC